MNNAECIKYKEVLLQFEIRFNSDSCYNGDKENFVNHKRNEYLN